MSSLRKPDFHVDMTLEEWRHEMMMQKLAGIISGIIWWLLKYVMPIFLIMAAMGSIINEDFWDYGWIILLIGICWFVLGYSRILTKAYKKFRR